MEIFSKRLRELREEAGLSQKKLSEKTSVSAASIGYYENGEREPGLDIAMDFAKFFGVTLDYLAGLEDCRQNKDMSAQLKIAAEMRGLLRDKRPIIGAGNALIVSEELWLKIADAVEGKCALWQEKWN